MVTKTYGHTPLEKTVIRQSKGTYYTKSETLTKSELLISSILYFSQN